MALNFKLLTFIPLFIIGISSGFAQKWFSNEIGIIAGPIAFQSDFGERRDFETNSGNTGMGIGLVHFMNFEYRGRRYDPYRYFFDHFKVRSELSWNKTELNHFGKWVAPERTGVNADKLRAHSGEANNFDFGMQLEYFPFSLKEFSYARHVFTPFVSLGVHVTSFNPKAFTSYGNANPNNLNNYYSPWYLYDDATIRDTEFITIESGIALSLVGSVGSRFKLTYFSDLIIDLRWQHFFSDKIDGLDHKLPSNKSNDYLLWLNVGYVYYLE